MNEAPGGLATGPPRSSEGHTTDLPMPPKKSRPCGYLRFPHPNTPFSTYSSQEASLPEPRQVVRGPLLPSSVHPVDSQPQEEVRGREDAEGLGDDLSLPAGS